jgi:hypothetical protein
VNRFYQRTLANDPDEALDQAEKMLADRSLVDYYDSVVLPALKLAADDEARGTISRQRRVACVAGRGPFDDAGFASALRTPR